MSETVIMKQNVYRDIEGKSYMPVGHQRTRMSSHAIDFATLTRDVNDFDHTSNLRHAGNYKKC